MIRTSVTVDLTAESAFATDILDSGGGRKKARSNRYSKGNTDPNSLVGRLERLLHV